MNKYDNEEKIMEIILAHQALMSLEKGHAVQITSRNRGGDGVRLFKRIK